MELRQVPALLPAAALVAGAVAGLRAAWAPPELALALAGAGVARGGRLGGVVVAAAVGLLAATLGPAPEVPRSIAAARPVTAVGRVADHWRPDGEEASVRFRLERLAQPAPGRPPRVERSSLEVRLIVPAGEELPVPGTTLRVKGALRRSPGFANALVTPPGPWRLRVKSRRLVEVLAPPGPLSALSARLRRRVEEAQAAAVAVAPPAGSPGSPGEGAALARALVLADASDLPERWRRGLRRTGLAHLMAVSGLHVGLVAGLAMLAAAFLGWRPRLMLALAAIAVYLLLAGPRPSLVRAATMGALAAVALLAARVPSGANALVVAAAGMVLARPALVDDLGFRLTVAATAGILFLAPALARRWAAVEETDVPGWPRSPPGAPGRFRRLLVPPFAATVAAQVVSLPAAAPAFHLVSLSAPLSNLVAVPWTAVALAVSLAWTALAVASPAAADRTLPLLDLVAAPFGWAAAGSPGWWGTSAVVAPPAVALALAVLLVAWLPAPLRRLPLLVAASLLVPAFRWGDEGPRRHPGVEAVVLDVGQGDAILLRDGPRALLVDGGGWPSGDLGGRVLVPALVAEGITRLDAVLLTHPDRDHCRGLVDLASYLAIRELWLARGLPPEGCAGELATAVAGQGGAVREVAAGDRRSVGAWTLRVLHPPSPGGLEGAAGGDNDASVVLLATAAGRRLLLTGDVEAASERRLVERAGDLLAAEVLKLAHHGSHSSSGPRFLAAVGPRLAIASAGAGNPYGHPAERVRRRLRQLRLPLLRTDHHGMVHLALPAAGDAGASTPTWRLRLGRLWPVGEPPRP